MDTRRIRTVIGRTVKSFDDSRATLGVIHVVSHTGVRITSSFVDSNEQVQRCGRRMSVHGMTHDACTRQDEIHSSSSSSSSSATAPPLVLNTSILACILALRCSRVRRVVEYFLLSAFQSFALSVGLKVGSSRMAA